MNINGVQVLSAFDYSKKPSNSLFDAVDWLLYNRQNIERIEYFDSFVAPSYWGMPRFILNHLTKKELAWLRAEVNCWNLNRMKEETLT